MSIAWQATRQRRIAAGSARFDSHFTLESGTNVDAARKRQRPQIRGVTFPLLQNSHDQEGVMPSGRRPHDVLAGRCVAPGSERRQLSCERRITAQKCRRPDMPAARLGPDATTAARDARRLSTLLEVSQALSGTLNLKAAMQRVLRTLHPPSQRRPRHGHAAARRRAARRSRRRASRIARARSAIKLGEGITGKVVESGKPIVVPRVSREPAFLNLAPRRPEHPKQELSFICVPIMLNRAGRRRARPSISASSRSATTTAASSSSASSAR